MAGFQSLECLSSSTTDLNPQISGISRTPSFCQQQIFLWLSALNV